MELNQRELKALYISLKEMCSNVDCDAFLCLDREVS